MGPYGGHTALAVKRAGEWKTWTYKAYYDDVQLIAKAFIHVSKVEMCVRFLVSGSQHCLTHRWHSHRQDLGVRGTPFMYVQ